MSTLRYYTEFWSRAPFHPERSALYRIEIYGTEGEVKEMTLSGDDPAVINWSEITKIDPVQGSSLTLRLVSESDREYVHLYSTEVGEWSVKVYRNGSLYWVGTLDTELYEEPYSRSNGYELEVTFSDFGALDRLDYEGSGNVSMQDILTASLETIGLSELPIKHTRSTQYPYDQFENMSDFNFSDIYINSGNFYDEDGEPMSLREVLEAILQPMALRMVQRAGRIEIFDLNAAYSSFDNQEIFWTSTDSQLGTDVTYNKVTVTLSTYSDTAGIGGESDHDTALKGAEMYPYQIDAEWRDNLRAEKVTGFYLAFGKEDTEKIVLPKDSDAKLFRIDSAFSSSDAVGVIRAAYGYNNINYDRDIVLDNPGAGLEFVGGGVKGFCGDEKELEAQFTAAGLDEFRPIFTLRKELNLDVPSTVQIGDRPGASSKRMLKLSLDLLLSGRYNPFEEPKNNEEGNDKSVNEEMHIVYIPFRLTLKPYNKALSTYWYSNRTAINRLERPIDTSWTWVYADGDKYTVAALAYYDESDPLKNAAVGGGWVTNRQSVGDPQTATKLMKRRGNGEFIPLPPHSGTLTLEIGRGITWRYSKMKPGWYGDDSRLKGKLRWLAYKDPKIEIVMKDGTDDNGDDIKDTAWIVKTAKEGLDINLTVGTPGELNYPTARAFLHKADGSIIKNFSRAGITDRLERLLIGTIYSQYAKRRTTLSGSCELFPYLCSITDAADPGEKYIMLSEVQHLRTEESEIKMAQFGADDYEGLEITSK